MRQEEIPENPVNPVEASGEPSGEMKLEVLGIGDAFSARHYGTSFLLHGTTPVLIDGPPGLFRLLRERGLRRESIGAVLATHVHTDHAAGLATLIVWRRFALGEKTTLLTSRAVFQELERALFPSFADRFSPDLLRIERGRFDDFVEFVELTETGSTPITPGVRVEVRHNWHPTPTLGLKLICDRGAVAVGGDTCFRPSLLGGLRRRGVLDEERFRRLAGDWLWSADVVYHEAARDKSGPHTSESSLLELPPDVRRRIRLIHVADDFRSDHFPVAVEGEKVSVTPGAGVAIQAPEA